MAELEQIEPGAGLNAPGAPHAEAQSAALRTASSPPMKRRRLRMKTVTTPTSAASSETDRPFRRPMPEETHPFGGCALCFCIVLSSSEGSGIVQFGGLARRGGCMQRNRTSSL